MKTNRRPKAELLMPEPGLSACIFGAFVRDTRGVGLPFDQRFSHFGASPFCCVSWLFEGDGYLLDHPEQMAQPTNGQFLSELTFSGPQTFPRTTWNSGDTHGMIVAFYPDAFTALTGVEIGPYFDQTISASEVLPAEFLDLVEAVTRCKDAGRGFKLLEHGLAPMWQHHRPGENVVVNRFSDWTRALVSRAMVSSIGRSTRQVERRIKRWAGQSKRNLNQFERTDLTYEQALIAWNSGDFNLADLSSHMGYSDQAHMSRMVKKQTGFSPAELMQRIEEDETFWSFRLLGERY